MTALEKFIDLAIVCAEDQVLSKFILSKQLHKEDDLLKISGKPVLLKNKYALSLTFHYQTKDEVKNFDITQFQALLMGMLGDSFLEGYLFDDRFEYQLRINGKGNSSMTKVAIKNNTSPTIATHNRQKEYLVPSDRPYLKALGLASDKGLIYDKSQAKFRQINKYVEIFNNLLEGVINKKDTFRIIDMGSGKGYLTFALYDYLIEQGYNVEIKGVELRNDLVTVCNVIAKELNYKGLSFESKDINEIENENIDVVIALHACDIATDIAIAKGIRANATIIVCAPCCHKQIRLEMKDSATQSPVLKHGILLERQAEIVTDALRALFLEAAQYKSQVFEFISQEHTSKNLMITAVKRKSPQDIIEINRQIAEIKAQYHVDKHALESMI